MTKSTQNKSTILVALCVTGLIAIVTLFVQAAISNPVQEIDQLPVNDDLLYGDTSSGELQSPGRLKNPSELQNKSEIAFDVDSVREVSTADFNAPIDEQTNIQLVQYGQQPTRVLNGVDDACVPGGREPTWRDSKPIPWEAFAYGEYVGPARTPHMNEYQIHIGDTIDFLYQVSRKSTGEPYRFQLGDELQIQSGLREELNQPRQIILPDGTISPTELGPIQVEGKTINQVQDLLNKMYKKGGTVDPLITVMALKSNTALNDLVTSIQGPLGASGIIRTATVLPDGTVHLPRLGRVPAIGLTIGEINQEVNFRYRKHVRGLFVTSMITQRANRQVFVLGEVANEGRFEMTGPTTALQALALAGGELQGANLRQIVVLRRDARWRLVATKLDLSGAVYGRKPQPSDEIWLRDSDIVIIPKMRIQRFSELVDMYITRTIYAIVPNSGFSFQFGSNSSL